MAAIIFDFDLRILPELDSAAMTGYLIADFLNLVIGAVLIFLETVSPGLIVDEDFALLVLSLIIDGAGLVDFGLDQIGSIELGGSGRSDGKVFAELGTSKLRSVTEGTDSMADVRDRSICSAFADVIFNPLINNGMTIVLDNHLIVDRFMVNRDKYDNKG
jgi:hypothetical protein